MALKQEIREYLQATEIPVAEPVHGEISLSACVFPFKQFLFMWTNELVWRFMRIVLGSQHFSSRYYVRMYVI